MRNAPLALSTVWDQGPAPRRGSWAHGQSGRGWALVQGQLARSGAEVVERTAPALCTDISQQASPAAHNPVPGCCTARPPRPHQHFPAAAPPGPLRCPTIQVECQPSALPHGSAQPPGPPRLSSPKAPRHGGNTSVASTACTCTAPAGAAAAGSRHGRAWEGVRRRCCGKRVREEDKGVTWENRGAQAQSRDWEWSIKMPGCTR